MRMPIAWKEFEKCVTERIAYYQQQYDQTIRMYLSLVKEDTGEQEQVIDILHFQQLVAEELTRLDGLLVKYSPTARTVVPDKKIILISPARLN
jgi:hypothetical protein